MEINKIYRHELHTLVGKVLLEEYCKAEKTIYVPLGITLKNSPFCPLRVFMCFVCN